MAPLAPTTVRARPGRLRPECGHKPEIFYGGFVWPRRARIDRKLRFPARAVRRSFEEFVDQHPFRRLVLAGNSRISRRAESLAREAARVFEGRRRATVGVDNPCEVAFKFPGGDSHGR